MTIKPSEELMAVSVDRVSLKKNQRQEISKIVRSKTGRRMPSPGGDHAKETLFRQDQRTEKYDPRKFQNITGVRYYIANKNGNLNELKKPLTENTIFDEYKPAAESDKYHQFFQRLEHAAEGYIVDIELDEKRPTPSSVKKRAQQIHSTSLRLWKHLSSLDDRSRRAVEANFQKIDNLSHILDELMTACDYISAANLSRERQARFNLCLSVIHAMHEFNLKPSSSRQGLADALVRYLANEVAAEHNTKCTIEDANDSLTAAMIEFRRLSKTG